MTDTVTSATSHDGAGACVRAVRRTPEQSRQDFTTLLDVLARPGKLGGLSVPDGVPPAAAAASGLADVEVPLHVLSAEDQACWGEAVHAATDAPRVEVRWARMVLALRPVTAEEIGRLHRGDPLNPELGARLIAAADTLHPSEGAVRLTVSGPGVPGERHVGVGGLPTSVFEALITANREFPLGVDTFLVAPDGTVLGLPRSARLRIDARGE